MKLPVANFNVLTNEAIDARKAACAKCPHAMGNPHDAWGRKLWWCGKLFDPTKRHLRAEQWRAYLRRLWEDPRSACPIGEFGPASRREFRGKDDPGRGIERRTKTEVFHALWAEVHDPARHWTPEWWRQVLMRLPCGECKVETKAYVEANPIPFGDDAACRAWGSTFHDAVSIRLGKPPLGLAGARERYGVSALR